MLLKRITPVILFACLLFFSCVRREERQETEAVPGQDSTPPKVSITDPFILKLSPVLADLETKDLEYEGTKPLGLQVDNISYEIISDKEYYKEEYRSLEELVKVSSDKEKTQGALKYLDKMMAQSSDKPDIYKVQFHLKAQVGEFNYDQKKNVYLKKDLTEIRIVYPG